MLLAQEVLSQSYDDFIQPDPSHAMLIQRGRRRPPSHGRGGHCSSHNHGGRSQGRGRTTNPKRLVRFATNKVILPFNVSINLMTPIKELTQSSILNLKP
ncbi:hypothetical protein MRB53_010325 [Persea americana]|uniref:Uncharacterized protein n=1 Tax=Persea americana TaxID=3435 RepID=A0ACC2LSA8_PERAE|nr:hypothetical protein MRB53_010325 [Persea americana]